MAGITLNVLANFRDFIRGTQDASKALDDVADALDDVVKDGDKGTERLERSFRDLADEAKDTGRDIEKGLGDGVRDGTRKAAKGLDDFKDEAGQSGREAAASFSGEFSDVGDFAQETIANGLAGFGPLGLAAGVGLAAAVGAGFANIEARAEQMEEFVSGVFEDMIESGNAAVSEGFINSEMQRILQTESERVKVQEQSERLGLSQQTILRAMAGDSEAINAALEAEKALHDENLAKINESEQSARQKQKAIVDENIEHQKTIGLYGDIAAGIDSAAGRAAVYNSAVETGNDKLDEGIRKIQDIASSLNGIGDKTIRLTADDSDIQRKLGLLQGRTITVNVNGQITRIGNQVW